MIRVLDVLVLDKDHDGRVAVREAEDLADCARLRSLAAGCPMSRRHVLARTDLDHLAAAIDRGTSAGVLVWEQAWVTPLADAARASGGRVLCSGRIPEQAIMATLAFADGRDHHPSAEDQHP
jgi:hypothetical protein